MGYGCVSSASSVYDAADAVSSARGSVYVNGVCYAGAAAGYGVVAAYDDYAVSSDYVGVGSGAWAGVAGIVCDDGVKG